MKKIAVLMGVTMLVFFMVACTNTSQPEKVDSGPEASYAGQTVETENFSILVPDDWQYMEVDGGLQLYKNSGEIIEVHYRGFNQGATHAKLQVENMAKNNKGSTPEEISFLGKTLWHTEFTAADKAQVFNAGIEDGILKDGEKKDGVMLSIKYTINPADQSPTAEEILSTIVWK